MRRITELFEAILVGSSLWIFADHQVFHDYDALYATDTGHFSKHQPWVTAVVQRKAGDHDIECLLSEREVLRISKLKAQIREAAFVAHLFCQGKRRFGEIDADDLAFCLRKGHRDITRTGGDIQDTVSRLRMNRLDEPTQAIGIGNGRGSSIGLGLLCERLANDGVVIS